MDYSVRLDAVRRDSAGEVYEVQMPYEFCGLCDTVWQESLMQWESVFPSWVLVCPLHIDHPPVDCPSKKSDYWERERYLDALFADHDKGHPGRSIPLNTCEYCCSPPVDLSKDSEGGISHA